ncbi:MAG: PEP-CTERM sorting domain-containing protein [Pirellulales bacterium]
MRGASARVVVPTTQQFFSAALVAVCVLAFPFVSVATLITFAPGDYDNTQNTVAAGPTPQNNQTTGYFRDIFWWGSANGVGDHDYINSGKNLISNGGSPQRAVVGGDDDALNFTGVGIPNGGKNFLTIYDTTPGDGTATRDLFDFSQPGGQTISADVLFTPGNHSASAGVVALFSEGQDALALLAHNGGGNNPDVPSLRLIFQSQGNGITLASVPLGAGGTQFLGDTNPGLNPAQAVGSTSGDHWYRVIMNIAVNGDAWTQTGSFWNHTDPTDPNSPLGTKITDLNFAGSLSSPGNLLDLTNPGEVGLMAHTGEGFGDGCGPACNPANPLVDNVGVSITNFDPGIIPEPSTLVLVLFGSLAIALRRSPR